MNGDQIRDTRFRLRSGGYEVNEVRNLLSRVAAAVDAGRPAGPLIEGTTFRRNWSLGRGWGYDVDAVDWFLGRLLVRPGDYGLGQGSGNPWRDLEVSSERLDDGFAARPGADRARAFLHLFFLGGPFATECRNAWQAFDQVPGPRLRWQPAKAEFYELRTADRETLTRFAYGRARNRRRSGHSACGVWGDGQALTVSRAGRNYTLSGSGPKDERKPAIAEITARSGMDCLGHFARNGPALPAQPPIAIPAVRELADELGQTVLYISGDNFFGRAYARISFPGDRWLRFLVRGTKRSNAVMTAVDQDGQQVVKYRAAGNGSKLPTKTLEIVVNPDCQLSPERILAITISAPWLGSYFDQPDSER